MSITEKVNGDLITAMKAGDSFTTMVLRGVSAALKNRSIEKRGKGLDESLTEEEVLDVLSKEVKKRRDAIDLYTKGNRADLAEKEQKETAIISKYLPQQLSREEVEAKINEVLGRVSDKSFGSVMREAMKELKGKADGQLISEIIKQKIQ